MESVWRFLSVSLLLIFCCSSECKSASVLDRRYLAQGSDSSDDLSTGDQSLELARPDMLDQSEESKSRMLAPPTFTKLPVLQRSTTSLDQRQKIKETAAALANYLDQRPISVSAAQLLSGDWTTGDKDTYDTDRSETLRRTGSGNGIWTLFQNRYAQNSGDPRTSQQDSSDIQQAVKRSPACLRKCIAQGFLHPAQCHSLC